MDKLTTIYYVRHGESEGNAGLKNDHTHGKGSDLSERGKKQAHVRAESLAHVQFDAAFSSNLARAIQTAEIITLERDLAVKATEVIRERSIADYLLKNPNTSRNDFEIEMQKALESLDEKAKLAYKHYPEMESASDTATRLLTFLREIAIAYTGKTVLVVGHGNSMRSLLTHLGWAKYDELPKGAIENTGYFILESDGTDFFIKETHGIHKQVGKRRGW